MPTLDPTHLDSWLFDVRHGNHLTEDIIRERLAAVEGNTAPLDYGNREQLRDGLLHSLHYHHAQKQEA